MKSLMPVKARAHEVPPSGLWYHRFPLAYLGPACRCWPTPASTPTTTRRQKVDVTERTEALDLRANTG